MFLFQFRAPSQRPRPVSGRFLLSPIRQPAPEAGLLKLKVLTWESRLAYCHRHKSEPVRSDRLSGRRARFTFRHADPARPRNWRRTRCFSFPPDSGKVALAD